MSTTSPKSDTAGGLEEPPEFDLRYRFDDPQEPTEVTVFPDTCEGDPTTRWLTIDKGFALPLEEVR
ncbi:MAG: hypothetical protein ABEJ55_00305 [Halanaeroarchaeum sp.]